MGGGSLFFFINSIKLGGRSLSIVGSVFFTNKNANTNAFTNLKVGGGSSSIVGSASSLHHPAPSSGDDGDHDDYETEDADDEDLVCTFVCGTEASQETS